MLGFRMTQPVHFRSANDGDYENICNLVTTKREFYFVYPRGTFPLTVEQVANLASVRKELTVAMAGTVIVGFANLYDFDGSEKAFIGNVVVAQPYRGNGLGSQLIEHMLRVAFSKYRLSEVHISVFSDNLPALLLYSKLGFCPYSIEERRNYEAKRVALIHMKLSRQNK